jgi:hypothetical protein
VQKKHSAKTFFAECQKKTLGKEAALPSAKKNTWQRRFLPSVFLHSARQFFKAHFEALNEFKLKSF